MKLKHVLLTAVALCCCIGLSAQRQKASNWNNVIEDIPVEYEFSYITGKTGAILDGPFKMYRHEEKEGPYKIYWRVSGIWSYKLTGSHTNGKLNGPISLTYIQKSTATNGEKFESTQTLKGNFLNGVPNGNFVVDYGKDSFGRAKYCNVTYKNGKLIGKYVTKGYTGSNNEYMEISGTLTSAGKMTGTWTMGSLVYDKTVQQYVLVNSEMQFQNHVRVDNDDATLSSYSKSYAAGQITKDQLLEKGVLVEKSRSFLQEDARYIIKTKDYIKWESLGEADFYTDTTQVGYDYLRYLPSINDEGVEFLANAYKGVDRIDSVQVYINYSDECNRYYVRYARDIDQYSIGVESYDRRIYLTAAQAEKLIEVVSAKVDETRREDERIAREKEQKMKAEYTQSIQKLLSEYKGKDYLPTSQYDSGEYDKEIMKMCFPYSAYSVKEILLKDDDDPFHLKYKAIVQLYIENSSKETYTKDPLKYYGGTTYEVTLHICEYDRVMYSLTFDKDNVSYIKNYWDQLNELTDELRTLRNTNQYVDKALDKYGYMLMEFSNTEKQKSAESRKKFVLNFFSESNSIMKYRDTINAVLYAHQKVQLAVSGLNHVEKKYSEYFNALDLNWTQTPGKTSKKGTDSWEKKLAEVLDVQEKILVFAEKRKLIAENDSAIMAYAEDAKNITKAYSTYFPTVDLALPADYSSASLDEVLKIQTALNEILADSELAAIDKSVKKAKLKEVSAIIAYLNTGVADTSRTSQDKAVSSKSTEESVIVHKEEKVKEEKVKEEKVKETKVREYRNKGLINSLQFNMQRSLSNMTSNIIGGDYMIGYRFSHKFTLSAGVGFSLLMTDTSHDVHNYVQEINSGASSPLFNGTWIKEVRNQSDYSSKIFLPVYLNAKYYFTKGGVQPFISASAGVYVLPLIFPKTEVGVGCNFRFANRLNAYLLLSLDTAVSPCKSFVQNYPEPYIVDLDVRDKADFFTPSIKVGFTF